MRIIGGELRGRRLRAPRGRNTRPTPDRVREALFQVLGEAVRDARVAELFGGTGALGLEALSRGAAHAVFCETDRAALACLRANVEALGVRERVAVLARSAFSLPRIVPADPPLDLVFCDPPHRLLDRAATRRRLEALLDALPLAPGATVVLEHPAGRLGDFRPRRLRPGEVRRWGSTGMAFYRPAPPPGFLPSSP